MRVDLRAEGHGDVVVALFSPGVVATDFGMNARYGGMDNRALPGAQPVEEVAAGLVAMLARPDGPVDVYSRASYRDGVAAWYSAEDVRPLEAKPPWVLPPRPPQ